MPLLRACLLMTRPTRRPAGSSPPTSRTASSLPGRIGPGLDPRHVVFHGAGLRDSSSGSRQDDPAGVDPTSRRHRRVLVSRQVRALRRLAQPDRRHRRHVRHLVAVSCDWRPRPAASALRSYAAQPQAGRADAFNAQLGLFSGCSSFMESDSAYPRKYAMQRRDARQDLRPEHLPALLPRLSRRRRGREAAGRRRRRCGKRPRS